MTAPVPPPPSLGPPAPRATPLARFGPLVAIVTALVLVAVAATTGSDANGTSVETGDGSSTTVASGEGLPITYAEAEEAGTVDDYEWGPKCDPETGRRRLPSVYAPPCVPQFEGDNGGATGIGVTADTVKVVVYIPKGTDLAAALQGLSDSDDLQMETRTKFVEMYSAIYETYGRKVELVPFVTTANGDDEAAAKADAIKVAEEIKPFASLGGPSLTGVYADELANRGILCLTCGLSLPDSRYQQNAPYMWGPTPPPEQFLLNLGDYVTGRLLGGKAEFAGPDLQDEDRVFGVVHFEQDPPVFGGVQDIVDAEGNGRGYEAKVTETYVLDVPKLAERATTIIAKLKANGVTTVIFLGDPLMPGYLTAEATAQDYYPEWVVTGTVLTDTTVFGRTYDQAQWEHAFGISNLAARTPKALQEPWRLHEWYFGEPPAASNTSAVVHPNVGQLMLGIHMAGPDLNGETWAQGMFRYPPSGGGPTTPRISYGDRGVFRQTDHIAIDDVTEIWWDPTAEGPDEQGKSDKPGMWRYSDGGKRYLPGEMPVGPPGAFREEGSITVYEELPPEDVPPSYPSPGPGG